MDVPVVLMVFNRPEETARVLERIAEAKPRRLLVISDGARPDIEGEGARVAEVRALLEHVDWPCDVERNYAAANLGCRRRISSGIDWVFERCDRAIFLEDDCLPDPTFFRFCTELLDRYADDERIAMISGNDFLNRRDGRYSYRFSAYAHIWGWASWARAWRNYDVEMNDWPRVRSEGQLRDLSDGHTEGYWTDVFDRTHQGEIDTWDFQWVYRCLVRGDLCIVPEGNLVTNIGFGPGATNLKEENHLADRPVTSVAFPLKHPPKVERDRSADRRVFDQVFAPRPRLRNRLSLKWRQLIRSVVGL